MPGDSVSTPSAGKIDLASGSSFTSIINAENINAQVTTIGNYRGGF